ncbi:MAG: cyclic nucleotide-binding domain-containing protein [Planctomycetota bacterium]
MADNSFDDLTGLSGTRVRSVPGASLHNFAALSGARASAVRRSGSIGGSQTTIAIEKQKSEGWVETIRVIALVVFIAIPIFAWFVQDYAGRVVWTVAVAVLPLFIVLVGYHRWRRICPLAFFSKLPGLLKIGGKRTVPVWLEKYYYVLALFFFIFGLWFRHVAMNGDGQAITVFFVGIALVAFVVGLIYTGKSWCNFICPVSFIEKIYTEPHGLRETANSQCQKCTACKKFCPDINQENGYWKELESGSKRIAYFTFPGLVYGFYFYYFLQANTWQAYFDGERWTKTPGMWRTAFSPGTNAATAGFYFWPECPRALAAIITLLVCGTVSLVFFSLLRYPIQAFLKRVKLQNDLERVRHTQFAIAGFVAFVTFYSFAGVPTLNRIQPAPHLFMIVVVLSAAIFLARRLKRDQRQFAEESLAKNIIKRWEWPEPAPSNLHDAFLIHTVRSKASAKASERALEIYKDALREALADGIVTREELHRLQALRDQLQIKNADHSKVMNALDEEARAILSDPSKLMSAEKRLQLDNYQQALEEYLDRAFAPGASADGTLLEQFRESYRVTPEEHQQVIEDLVSGERGLGARLSEAVGSIEVAAQTIVALKSEPTAAHDFLRDILERRRTRAVMTLAKGLMLDEGQHAELTNQLCSDDRATRATAVERLSRATVPILAERFLDSHRDIAENEAATTLLSEKILRRTHSADPYERALAIYISGATGAADETKLSHVADDQHPVVSNTMIVVRKKFFGDMFPGDDESMLSIVEKMIALRAAPIFSRLAPESLERLAHASNEDIFGPGEVLFKEGDDGSEVFILVAGDVEVVRGEGADRKVLAREKAGGFIGELAVLDPAPRSASVVAGSEGSRVLRLDGQAFRDALHQDSSIAEEVLKTLAQRLKNSRS